MIKLFIKEKNISNFYSVARDLDKDIIVEGPDQDGDYYVSPEAEAEEVIQEMKCLGRWS